MELPDKLRKIRNGIVKSVDKVRKVWKRIASTDRWTVGLVLAVSTFFFAGYLRGSASAVELSETMDFVVSNFQDFAMWLTAICSIKKLTVGWDNTLNMTLAKASPSHVGGQPFTLPYDELLKRSDHLDEVLSNLRTGISILLGIGAALVVWAIGDTTFSSTILGGMMIASALLVFSAILAILQSFSNPELQLGASGIGEGLLPNQRSKLEYIGVLENLIQVKERSLRNMRTMVGLGLIGFFLFAVFGFSLPSLLQTPPPPEGFWTTTYLENLQLLNLFTMAIFLFQVASMVLGRHILGIIDIRFEEE